MPIVQSITKKQLKNVSIVDSWWNLEQFGCKKELHAFGVFACRFNTSYVEWKRFFLNKKKKLVWSLEKNPPNSSYIFLLDVNFENLTIELHVLIISSMLVKFQKDQKSITILSTKYLNSSFWGLQLCIKSKIINQTVNNI